MSKRWEGDTRGRGVGDAVALVSGASDLLAAFSERAWVAEDPDVHLRPHIEAWCLRDGRIAVSDAHTDDSGAYVLELEWRAPSAGVGETRAAVFSLIGSFAETATYVRQRRIPTDGDDSAMKLRFEIGTGELAPDTRFDPHGHVVIVNVAGVL
jgi:hypothetical protein